MRDQRTPKDVCGEAMPDPDLEVGGGQSPKKNFSALQASVWSKNKEGGGPPWVSPLDPPLKLD